MAGEGKIRSGIEPLPGNTGRASRAACAQAVGTMTWEMRGSCEMAFAVSFLRFLGVAGGGSPQACMPQPGYFSACGIFLSTYHKLLCAQYTIGQEESSRVLGYRLIKNDDATRRTGECLKRQAEGDCLCEQLWSYTV